ncbi:MAG: phosphotransferase, partial [Pontixanthobacter sp.]
MAHFPTRAEDISPEFLSEILQSRVADCDCKSIGAGLVGDSARISVQYASGATGPASIAGKFPAQDPTSRSTGASMQLYEKEVGFYTHVAPSIGTRTPAVYFAEHDPASGDFLLLMEDCGPAIQGDQLASCTLEQAIAAVSELARLHGPTYEHSRFLELDFLQPNNQVRAFAAAGYPGASEQFREFYQGNIEDDLLDYICNLGQYSAVLFGEAPSGPCVIHGDFRLDNMLFDIGGGAE